MEAISEHQSCTAAVQRCSIQAKFFTGIASIHRLHLQQVIKQTPEREAALVINLGLEDDVPLLSDRERRIDRSSMDRSGRLIECSNTAHYVLRELANGQGLARNASQVGPQLGKAPRCKFSVLPKHQQ